MNSCNQSAAVIPVYLTWNSLLDNEFKLWYGIHVWNINCLPGIIENLMTDSLLYVTGFISYLYIFFHTFVFGTVDSDRPVRTTNGIRMLEMTLIFSLCCLVGFVVAVLISVVWFAVKWCRQSFDLNSVRQVSESIRVSRHGNLLVVSVCSCSAFARQALAAGDTRYRQAVQYRTQSNPNLRNADNMMLSS